MIEFRFLGQFDVVDGTTPLAIGGPRQRSCLAVLVCHVNRVVAADELITALWGEVPPAQPNAAIRVFISKLRKVLASAVSTDAVRIDTVDRGYRLHVASGLVDVMTFEHLVRVGRRALGRDEARDAVEAFDRALGLVRGSIGGGVEGPALEREAMRLAGLRAATEVDLLDAKIRLGEGASLLGTLERMSDEHPFDERLRGLLMVALYRSGRQADALSAFQGTRVFLREELGLEPGPDLQALEGAILRHDVDVGSAVDETAYDGGATSRLRGASPSLATLRFDDGTSVTIGSEPCLLGRAPECDAILPGTNVSRRHAAIRLIGASFVLTDLGSTNGTKVNGATVAESALVNGDVLEFAEVGATFELA